MVSCGVPWWTTKEVARMASLRKDDRFHLACYRCHCREKAINFRVNVSKQHGQHDSG